MKYKKIVVIFFPWISSVIRPIYFCYYTTGILVEEYILDISISSILICSEVKWYLSINFLNRLEQYVTTFLLNRRIFKYLSLLTSKLIVEDVIKGTKQVNLYRPFFSLLSKCFFFSLTARIICQTTNFFRHNSIKYLKEKIDKLQLFFSLKPSN